MRKTVTVTGKGMNEQQAKVNAYNDLKAQFKNNVLVYGMLSCVKKSDAKSGQQCTTENFPATGARKWLTQHNVYAVNPNNESEMKFIKDFPDKTNALKHAKELALKYQSKFAVKVEKVLDDGLNIEAMVTPKGVKEGEWTIQLDIEVVA